MKIGILQTGRVPEELYDQYGEYPDMFQVMLAQADPTLSFQTWAALDNVLPGDPRACEAWLITGSKFGVYDPEPWIEPLKDFLRAVRAARVPLIGICFGHQVMAEAFGGRAVKSDKGWGAGVHSYRIDSQPGWFGHDTPGFEMYAMHQDQVTALPDDATVLASSEFCPVAMVAYGDVQAPEAISIQPHPEFPGDYARALIDIRGELLGADGAARARASFETPVHGRAFAEWAVRYLQTVRAPAA